MKVLVLGGTGFVGFPAAQALVRKGYTVYSLARSEVNERTLAAEEIIPISGAVSSDAWIPLIATLDRSAAALRPPGSPPLSYIYTSGTWVHGDSRTTTVTDTTPIVTPPKLVAWRPAIEQLVVSSTVLNGIGAAEGRVSWPGTPGGRYALVHADDLAELYVLCAEKASVVGGKIFDGANSVTESVDDLLEKLVRVSGAKGPCEYREPADPFEEAITTTTLLRPYLANALLGWTPKKQGFVDGLEVYYAAWQASL
ncbi:NAD(P)-binding protein [Favolaschia claudopus]|uniref:NAD(P)-binding protein n=1 Tax=Favolaschia claudopus TaxID=2862362 RepID=A0AAV9Z9S6_9AGAR